MKIWVKIIIIIAIIIAIFVVGVEVMYHSIAHGVECCSCCNDSTQTCISACCECNYSIFEKISVIIDYYKN